ncbi:hypothetical protein CC86DRAFT_151156 [Ophiobolus disseminans]|uniref:Uncharacterized protein n=1 Tax=Ophiobolus disseminans TaxID=1469910 RepID=A0A6A6ZDM2_9PLEO|nr:hypothetical protein CC86DRAFT_151156 [Ophiobolus disseminans]
MIDFGPEQKECDMHQDSSDEDEVVAHPSTTSTASALSTGALDPSTTIIAPVVADNLDGSKVLRGKNATLFRHSTPKYQDVRVLGTLPISAEELLAFLPLHFSWSSFLVRLKPKGWSMTLIARVMLYFRGVETDIERHKGLRELLAKQANVSIKELGKTHIPGLALGSRSPPAMSSLQNITSSNTDCSLLRLVERVTRFPTGSGRRLLNEVIHHAQRNNHRGILLSQVQQYASQFALTDNANITQGVDPDTESVDGFNAIWSTAYPTVGNTKRGALGWGRS